MKAIPSPATQRLPRALFALSLTAALAACGGGGSDAPPPSTAVSAQAAKDASANTASIPNDSATAMSTVVATAEAVVAAGSANVTVACAGGGTAVYMVTGPAAGLLNHQLDQGESYSLTFNNCKSASGASSVNGAMTLDVTTKTTDTLVLSTTTNNVVVALPHREITLNGSSTISRTIVTAGTTTTTTTHWVTPNFSITSNHNGRISSFAYSNVDITRTIVVTNGVVTSTSYNGTSTLSWTWPTGSFSITFATQGTVSCDPDGTPTQGTWTITMPNNRLILTIVPGMVTLAVDYGNDGSIDRTYTFTVTDLMDGAG
jgi:hypothetical protein